MRKIKFRAWDGHHMTPWEQMKDILGINHWIYGDEPGIILMQSIGFEDKNKVEIYEGDIVKYEYTHYRKSMEVITDVYWGYHGFYIRRNETKLIDSRVLTLSHKIMEVIGNIYQNPELLQNK